MAKHIPGASTTIIKQVRERLRTWQLPSWWIILLSGERSWFLLALVASLAFWVAYLWRIRDLKQGSLGLNSP